MSRSRYIAPATLLPPDRNPVLTARQPGANEIIVVGVTPTADEHSIKVEGTGSAIITDITVELLPNRDIFQEIYPESDSDDDKDESDDDDDDDADKINAALDALREKLDVVGDDQKRAAEIVASAESRLKILDAYGKSLDKKRGVDIEASVETYRKEREKVFKDHLDGLASDRALAAAITKLCRDEARLLKLQEKEATKAARVKAKVKRAKEKLRAKQQRRDDEKAKEKARVHKEREQFWAKSCYTVRISLDAGANFTPGSSRRNSIASATDVQLAKKDDAAAAATSLTCDLALEYVTSSAFWSPSYDLALSSTTNTATLSFDARLTNMTSETWTNSKVVLSTSQANFSGLQDDTPTLVPWRLKIAGRHHGGNWDGLDIAYTREERAEKEVWNATQNQAQQKPRAALFGASYARKGPAPHGWVKSLAPPMPQALPGSLAAANFAPQAQQQEQSRAEFGFGSQPSQAPQQEQARGGFGFGQSSYANVPDVSYPNALPSSFGVMAAAKVSKRAGSRRSPSPGLGGGGPTGSNDPFFSAADEADLDGDAQTILDPTPEVAFQDSSFEETGLTATYDLPHTKTLKPSSTASKQRVARVSFAHVTFARTVVAKYKPAAYLRARLRNTSKLTLLKGPTGLTLDGTFLGRSTLPRCSAGDAFNMPLGVDPAIRVAYPKAEVARSTTGVFSKGENSVYTRCVTLVNTRAAAGKAVGVTVVDQVPVSEDEKLRVDVLQPAGVASGRPVATGLPGKEGAEGAEWGRATASLKKAGEVQWEVVLNAGKSVKLMLQYEVAFPTGSGVTQVY